MDREIFIQGVILGVQKKGEKITFQEIAETLNQNGYKNDRGGKYVEGGIGIGKLIASLQRKVLAQGNQQLADIIAHTVVNSQGNISW